MLKTVCKMLKTMHILLVFGFSTVKKACFIAVLGVVLNILNIVFNNAV